MQRRTFLGWSAAAALAERRAEAAIALAGRASSHNNTAQGPTGRMKAGTQHGDSDDILRTLPALGVNHICGTLPSRKLDEAWSVEGLSRLRERVESFGIRLEMLPLPLSSVYITRAEYPHIMLGKSPERDREIDQICQMIRNAARAGIPALKYNLTILGVVRTSPVRGRGG
ncbi:MAG: mannonate dehydratase, partial [Bryobacteraceae bacterium]